MKLLDEYLKRNNTNIKNLSTYGNISISTLRNLNNRKFNLWTMENIDLISKYLSKDSSTVISDLKSIENEIFDHSTIVGTYNISNRRYIGSKRKMLDKISELIDLHTKGNSFFDVFAGTGIVTNKMLSKFDKFIVNDFLFSNEQIYNAFFGNQKVDLEKLIKYKQIFNDLQFNNNDSNYFSINFGGKFFSKKDSYLIGEIREIINNAEDLNERERAILITSLIYSSDKISNTVGHYDAYRKVAMIKDRFEFNLIKISVNNNFDMEIYRSDSNKLVREVYADVAFVDPPYNSRQYSRFYHVLENLVKWEKPELTGVALKPPSENMSDYSKVSAPVVFEDLILNLRCKYIVVTYNNTYNSKSNSSKNKITHEQIVTTLNKVGSTKIFEIPFQYFSAGKTNFYDHKEFVFITEVRNAQ